MYISIMKNETQLTKETDQMSHYGFPNLTDEFQVWVRHTTSDFFPNWEHDVLLLECDTRAEFGQSEDELKEYIKLRIDARR